MYFWHAGRLTRWNSFLFNWPIDVWRVGYWPIDAAPCSCYETLLVGGISIILTYHHFKIQSKLIHDDMLKFNANNLKPKYARIISEITIVIGSFPYFPLKISFSDNVACCVSLLPSKWWSESGRTNSVWPDGNIIFNILPLKSVKNWPILTIKIAKVGSKYCQILTCTKIQPNTYKILTKLLNWAKPGHTVCVKNFYASKNKTRIRILSFPLF